LNPSEQNIYRALRKVQEDGSSTDVLITLAPFDYTGVMNWLHSPIAAYGFAPHKPPLHSEETRLLENAMQSDGLIWLLTARIPPGWSEALPERWLAERAFLISQEWFGDFRLIAFAPPRGLGQRYEINARFEEGIVLEGIVFYSGSSRAIRTLRLSLLWRAEKTPSRSYTAFVHLLTNDGRFLAGNDAIPVDNYRPTNKWETGERIIDHRAITLPVSFQTGEYTLEIGLYNPSSGKRLKVWWNGQEDTRVLVNIPSFVFDTGLGKSTTQ